MVRGLLVYRDMELFKFRLLQAMVEASLPKIDSFLDVGVEDNFAHAETLLCMIGAFVSVESVGKCNGQPIESRFFIVDGTNAPCLLFSGTEGLPIAEFPI